VKPVRQDAGVSADVFEVQVRRLRVAGLTPKLIARKLGVPTSRVGPVVAAIAVQHPRSDDVAGCWVSPGWSRDLLVAGDRQWPDGDCGRTDAPGMVAVLVARHHRYDKVSVCGYLVDGHCLGVKNAIGPRVMEHQELPAFTRTYFADFDGDPVPAPLELAQHLVFGAIEYAKDLGFKPHPDFASAAGHLGAWEGSSDITFGRDGKPFYVQGPYDDPAAVMQTLNRTVGRDNYDYMIGVT
jgi:hypothetical protein